MGNSHTKKLRKRYASLANKPSVQSGLIDRAIVVAERRNFMFQGECAMWLRDLADGASQRIFQPVGREVAASDPIVLREIEKALRIMAELVLEVSKLIRSTAELTVDILRQALDAIAPAPPVTD